MMLALVGIAASLWACYPGDGPTVSETDVVVTLFRDDAEFGKIKTYWMPDSVFHLNDPDDPTGDILTRENDALILRTIKTNMADYGYRLIDLAWEDADSTILADSADVVLGVSAVATKNVVIGIAPPWWGYPGWGWGGWNPWYPPTYTSGSFTTGTLFIDMYDIQGIVPGEERISVPWTASANGLLTSSPVADRIVRAIDQAYAQSPYLDNSN